MTTHYDQGAGADFAELIRLRDRLKGEAVEMFDGEAAKLDAKERGAPRWLRRRINVARRMIAKKRRDVLRLVDRKFDEITEGFDAETGTLEGVQEEAAQMLADALKDVA